MEIRESSRARVSDNPLSGNDGWRAGPVMADDEPHSEVEYAVSDHMPLDDVILLHSTSWRVDGPRVVLTYGTSSHHRLCTRGMARRQAN